MLDAAADDREEIVITRTGKEPVILITLADYESLREAAYLMRSPANARRLQESIDRLECGEGVEHGLIEE